MKNFKHNELIWTGVSYEYGYILSISDDLIVVKDFELDTEIDCNPSLVQRLSPFMMNNEGDVLIQKYKGIYYYHKDDEKTEITYDEAIRSGYTPRFHSDIIKSGV